MSEVVTKFSDTFTQDTEFKHENDEEKLNQN